MKTLPIIVHANDLRITMSSVFKQYDCRGKYYTKESIRSYCFRIHLYTFLPYNEDLVRDWTLSVNIDIVIRCIQYQPRGHPGDRDKDYFLFIKHLPISHPER